MSSIWEYSNALSNEVKKMKLNYEIVDMNLFGEKFRRMYIHEPMTVHEIREAFHSAGMDKNDEIYYSVGIVDRETECVPLKMI